MIYDLAFVRVCVCFFSRSIPYSPFAVMSIIFTISCVLRLSLFVRGCTLRSRSFTTHNVSTFKCSVQTVTTLPILCTCARFFLCEMWMIYNVHNWFIDFFPRMQYTNGTNQTNRALKRWFLLISVLHARRRLTENWNPWPFLCPHTSASVTLHTKWTTRYTMPNMSSKFKIGFYLNMNYNHG